MPAPMLLDCVLRNYSAPKRGVSRERSNVYGKEGRRGFPKRPAPDADSVDDN